MLNRIIHFALHHRMLVLIVALGVAIYGTTMAFRLSIDVLPDLNRPRVVVLAEAHGLVPEDMERRIALPLERALAGAPGLQRIKTHSGMGLCSITLDFAWDTEIYRNRQVVQERLTLARERLPDDVHPRMAPIASLMGQVQVLGLRVRQNKEGMPASQMDTTELRALADQVVRYRLLAVPGVAQVVAAGGAPRQLQVVLDADRMAAHNVSVEDVERAVKASNLAAGGGVLNVGTQGLLVQLDGLLTEAKELGRAVLRPDPVRPLLIQDVAEVRFGPALVRNGDVGVDGQVGVMLVVYKQPGVDTLELGVRLDAELESIQQSLPDAIEVVPGIYRQADFIQRAVDNVSEAIRDGAILTLLVLFLFLMNLRTTVITLLAIPLSVAVTATVFHWTGVSLNTMTLGGLAVAIGALVDDAIVDVENVFRRLRQNRERDEPRPTLQVVFAASSEVRQPILIGTLVVTVVYLPLFALSGMEGRLFAPIGVTYILSILASLFVALTVTPVLCYLLLPNSKAMQSRGDSLAVRGLKRLAATTIGISLAAPRMILTWLLAFVVASLAVLWTRGSEFLPAFHEGTALVTVALPAGTNLEHSAKIGKLAEQVVLKVGGVQSVGRLTGRAEEDEHADPIQFSHMFVNFDPASKRSRGAVLDEVRESLAKQLPGVITGTEQPLAHLLSHLLSGVNAQVAIKVRGPALDVLRNTAETIRAAISAMPGVTDVFVEQQGLVEQVLIRPRRQALAQHGVAAWDVIEAAAGMLEGHELSRLQQGEFLYPIVMRLEDQDRQDLGALRRLPIFAPSGKRLQLSDVAVVERARTPNAVQRENGQRQIVVQHNISGRSLGEVAAAVDRRLQSVRDGLPPGYSVQLSGQFEAQSQASRIIALLSLVSLLLMAGLVYSHFRSWNLVLQTLLNIPMAFVGAVALILFTGQNVSVATLVGLISLGGIAVRNKILLLDHYLYLLREEGMPFGRQLILQAGQERIVPVLMTALTSGIALLPLVLWPDEPGRELLYPIATVIVGGLVTTTILDLLLTPGVFLLFGERAARAVVSQAADSSVGSRGP